MKILKLFLASLLFGTGFASQFSGEFFFWISKGVMFLSFILLAVLYILSYVARPSHDKKLIQVILDKVDSGNLKENSENDKEIEWENHAIGPLYKEFVKIIRMFKDFTDEINKLSGIAIKSVSEASLFSKSMIDINAGIAGGADQQA